MFGVFLVLRYRVIFSENNSPNSPNSLTFYLLDHSKFSSDKKYIDGGGIKPPFLSILLLRSIVDYNAVN